MKKRLASFALASLICGSVVEARFYLGFDLGYTGAMSYGRGKGMYYGNVEIQDLKYMFKTFSKSDEKGSVKMEPFMGFNTNINFGTENFYLDNYLGFRWGASIGYTTVSQTTEFRSQQSYGTAISSIIEEYNFLDFGLSIDAILNFWNNGAYSVGVFGGVEGEYHYFLSGRYDNYNANIYESFRNIHSYGINGRIGLSTLFAENHRVDFTAKIPILIAGNNWIYSNASCLIKTSFDIGYKYVF